MVGAALYCAADVVHWYCGAGSGDDDGGAARRARNLLGAADDDESGGTCATVAAWMVLLLAGGRLTGQHSTAVTRRRCGGLHSVHVARGGRG